MQQVPPLSPQESDPTDSSVRTRSGRISKPPVRYEPVEQVEDDYAPEDYDTDEDDVDDIEDDDDDEEFEEDDDEDADEYGNLDGFVVPDKNESDEDYNGPPFVPVVKKRRIA